MNNKIKKFIDFVKGNTPRGCSRAVWIEFLDEKIPDWKNVYKNKQMERG